MSSLLVGGQLLGRALSDPDSEEGGSPGSEIQKSWALLISIILLIVAFFTSYMLQQKKVTAIHETVISIFAGMTVGLMLLMTSKDRIRGLVMFDPGIFFNLLLPPIILSSGYELHKANFFRNIGTILTFAFVGTFLSAVVIGLILWIFSMVPGLAELTFVDCISVGATLSATDPVTILAIFTSYKVDPKLYTIIFGESILNDAIAIVIFETARKYKMGEASSVGFISFFEGTGIFLLVFFVSLLIGVFVGVGTALLLKFTYVRRQPQTESCLIILLAYSTYFFSQAVHMSGIVSLLFCGITMKHYAYFNMSRRTQLTTKYLFRTLAQLSENFIFIYLGLALFANPDTQFQPIPIIITVLAVCAARWVAVFPLSKAINWFVRYRARRRGCTADVPDELPWSYQAMLFWAGLRGAVGVALAGLMEEHSLDQIKATILVVVVLTVIIFGGTTARMLDILGIQTGVVEDVDSDDEFDIEPSSLGPAHKRTNHGLLSRRNIGVSLGHLDTHNRPRSNRDRGSYVSTHSSPGPANQQSTRSRRDSSLPDDSDRSGLLSRTGTLTDSDVGSDVDTSDLPPPARRPSTQKSGPTVFHASRHHSHEYATPTHAGDGAGHIGAGHVTASSAIRQFLTSEDPAGLFRQLDEDFIKPTLLLDGGSRTPGGSGSDQV